MDEQRRYIALDANAGYPAGSHIRYECERCGDVLDSTPEHAIACKCGNIVVDVDAGRVAVKNRSEMRVFIVE